MLVEGKDEDGNRIILQIVRRGKTVYLRRVAKQSIDLAARTPRQLWYLAKVSEHLSDQFGKKRTGLMPVTAEALRESGSRIAAENPYPKKEPHQHERQELLFSPIPRETRKQMETFSALPTSIERLANADDVIQSPAEFTPHKVIILRRIETKKEERDSS